MAQTNQPQQSGPHDDLPAQGIEDARKIRPAPTPDFPGQMESAMGGGSDATSGGGAGAGIPDPDTVLQTGNDFNQGDVDADRKKLFPENEPRK
jgi:hypothetical protein